MVASEELNALLVQWELEDDYALVCAQFGVRRTRDLRHVTDADVEEIPLRVQRRKMQAMLESWRNANPVSAVGSPAAALPSALLTTPPPSPAPTMMPAAAQPAFVFRGPTAAAVPPSAPQPLAAPDPAPTLQPSVPLTVPSAPSPPPESDEEEAVPLAVVMPMAVAVVAEEEESYDEESYDEEYEDEDEYLNRQLLLRQRQEAHARNEILMRPSTTALIQSTLDLQYQHQAALASAPPPRPFAAPSQPLPPAPVAAAGAPVPVGGAPVAGALVDGGEHISLKVKGQDGNIVHFKIKRGAALKKLMEAFCQRQSLQIDQIRFLFDGARLRDNQTPDQLDMGDDDIIDAMLFQVGDIGEWGEHSERVGTRFLRGDTASPDDARAILRGLGVKEHRMFESIADVGVDGCGRGALMRHADSKQLSAGEADLKLQLSHAELASFVGEEAAGRLDALFRRFSGGEEKEYTVKIRRVEAVAGGRCINFHTDVSRRTMQVRLNSGRDYDGGQLVFATEEGLVATSREAGSATLHDSSIAHGVSLHTRGVRYSLFFLDSPADAPRAA